LFFQDLWGGLSVQEESQDALKLGTAVHDGTYSIDFAVHRLSLGEVQHDKRGNWIIDYIIDLVAKYRKEHVCKIIGIGIAPNLHGTCPELCSRLWSKLDIIPVIVKANDLPFPVSGDKIHDVDVDEIADSAARKCLA
jgi:hypothetical protein